VLTSGTNSLSVIFTATDTADYGNVTNTVSLVVLPASLAVTASNQTKTYGQSVTFAGTEFTTSGLVNGDTVTSVTLASSGAAANASAAGSPYPIILSAAVGGGLTNYTITYVDGVLSVNQASPIITWTNPVPIIYGTALGSNQLDALQNVAGSFAYEPTNGAVLNTGTNLLSGIFTPIDALDYNSATDSVSLVVLPAPLIVTASNASRPYGSDNPVFTGEIIGLTNDDNITVTYTCGASTNSPPGMYDIVPSLVDPGDRQTNYTVSLINGTLTVNPAPPQISVQPTNLSVVAGGGASFSVTAAGSPPLIYQWQFYGADIAAATNTLLLISAVGSTNAGSYDVVITNSFGSITSATVTLSVLGVPVSFVTTSGGIQFSNGQLFLSLSGLTGQGSVLVEASSDLLQWIPVFTNPPGFGTIQLVDPAATNYQNRYYRVSTSGP
jgi:hypothetical protein